MVLNKTIYVKFYDHLYEHSDYCLDFTMVSIDLDGVASFHWCFHHNLFSNLADQLFVLSNPDYQNQREIKERIRGSENVRTSCGKCRKNVWKKERT